MTTPNYIQVPPNSSGEKVATAETTDENGDTVQIQKVMAAAVVSESPPSFSDDTIQPLSITAQGRLRVSSVQADIEKVWQGTWGDPWGSANNAFFKENLFYV